MIPTNNNKIGKKVFEENQRFLLISTSWIKRIGNPYLYELSYWNHSHSDEFIARTQLTPCIIHRGYKTCGWSFSEWN